MYSSKVPICILLTCTCTFYFITFHHWFQVRELVVHARFGNDDAVSRSCCCSPRSLQYEGFQLISSSRDITLRGTPLSVHIRTLIHLHFCGSYKQGKLYYDKAQIHYCLYHFFLEKYRKLAGFSGQWSSFSF